MPDEIGRVTILAVGVWEYQHMGRLAGPERDILNLHSVLIDDPELAIFQQRQYRELRNPTSEQLRRAINQYVQDRGADHDILLFYFSGHGVTIEGNDFAFCTIDTDFTENENILLPMTSVSFTEILRTLWIKKVFPVFIIDACYAGMAAGVLLAMVNNLQGEVQRRYASSYALLCTAPNDDEVPDNPQGNGSLFSNAFVELAQTGINPRNKRSQTITLNELFPHLRSRIERLGAGPMPILLLGPTLPDFSIFKNIHYQPLEYRLQPHLVAVLRALWNNGEPVELRPSEIADLTGLKGAYGNHQKLSFAPWDLVETVGNRRRLNERGKMFMQGRLRVPRDIVRDAHGNIYIEKPGAESVGIDNFAD